VKIAVVGCGAVGSYYGAQLARAGHAVHFLLRSDYEAVRRQGVRIQSPEGQFQVHPHCARRPEEIGPADLVLIGLKTTANGQFPALLPPLVGPESAVLTLQNGLGNEEQLARLFPAAQILGGLCFVCLNRIAPGVIRHIGAAFRSGLRWFRWRALPRSSVGLLLHCRLALLWAAGHTPGRLLRLQKARRHLCAVQTEHSSTDCRAPGGRFSQETS